MPVFLLAQPVFLPEAPLGGFVGKWTVQHEYLLQTIFVIVCCLAPQGASGLKIADAQGNVLDAWVSPRKGRVD